MKLRRLTAALAVVFFSTAVQAELNTVAYISHDDGGAGRLDLDGNKGEVIDSLSDPMDVSLDGVSSYTLLDGEGGDMWNGGDQFTYLYDKDKVQGDFTATVRVIAQTESVEGRWGKAGIRASANLTGNSQNAMSQVYSGTGSQVDPPDAGDHSQIPVRIGGRTGSDGNGGFEIGVQAPIDPTGLTINAGEVINNVFPESAAGVENPTTNVSWLRLHYNSAANSFVTSYALDNDGTPGSWGYSPVISNVPAPSEDDGPGWYVGLGYSAHNSLMVNDLADDDGFHGITFDNYSIVDEYIKPEQHVAGLELGALALSGETSDIVLGDPVAVPGLSQFWFKGNMRPGDPNGGPEAYLAVGTEGNDTYPLINPGGAAIVNETTWWRGSQGQVLTDTVLPQYPPEVAASAGWNGNQYAVKLTGEVFITEDGEYLIRDGIDDFTMVAIDADGNGELDELDGLVNGDEGTLGGFSLGDVHVLDDDWANLDGGSQEAGFHGLAEIENIPADGEWRRIEIWMGEDGGGDGGIVYMGNLDDPDIFDDTVGGALSQEERDKFAIKQENLRTQIPSVVSGKSTASLSQDVQYVMEVGADGSDQIVVSDADGALETTLDISGATIRVDAAEGLAEGTVATLFDADSIVGAADANFVFADPSQWDLSNIASGQITFGQGSACNPNSQGDLDGNGTVEFADFLVMSANFGSAVGSHAEGDIDCNGTVEFADFLVLSANFGNAVAGDTANSVPEPSGLALLGIAALLGGAFHRRR